MASQSSISQLHDKVSFHHFSLSLSFESNRFEDVRFVLVAGCPYRAQAQAAYLAEKLFDGSEGNLPKHGLEKLTLERSRFSLFKVGPVLISNHGMGPASMSIALHELFLMCKQAGILRDLTVLRFGTCGGIGVEPGTICITNKAMDSLFQDWVEYKICGKRVRRSCRVHRETAILLEYLALKYQKENEEELGDFDVRKGATISTNDFYEEQGRTNGAICEHTEEDKMRFLVKAQLWGVINMEMESNYMSAMCDKLKVPFGVVCVALNNRLREDDVKVSSQQLDQFEKRLFWLNSVLIKHKLSSTSEPIDYGKEEEEEDCGGEEGLEEDWRES